ncbi:hypothetical protein PoB_000846400 [Plakobranchus ocellatus]|uniref:Uncharacterized protein n=1 Tax=Plakobranchus ocellatus TaxID=259542 RepID=A0AAV3YG31_9GAST|nr:hypothetical protein PoB_000846400 [Plakobranchus ocellatus]
MRWFRVTNRRRDVCRRCRANLTMIMKVCSNLFVEGRPMPSNPLPVIFLTSRDYNTKKSPRKRPLPTKLENQPSTSKTKEHNPDDDMRRFRRSCGTYSFNIHLGHKKL